MYTLEVFTEFDAAQHIEGYYGPCANVHGHRWRVYAKWQFKRLDDLDIAFDLVTLKGQLRRFAKMLDHHDINNKFKQWTQGHNATAERLAEWFFAQLKAIPVTGECLKSVSIDETPETHVTYEEDNNDRD